MNFTNKRRSAMFGLIKKVIDTRPIATVEMIHAEFDNAAEQILSLAEGILVNEDDAEIEGLRKAGFHSMGEVVERTKDISRRRHQITLAEYARHYQKQYPQNHFIEETQIVAICKKYGLVHASAREYIGSMPVKNRKELLAFKCEDGDKIMGYPDYWYYGQTIPRPEPRLECQSVFSIVAQPSDFDMSNKEITSDFKLRDKDPIVLYSVKGGYLVVTAWGKEATDVANPNRN